MSNFDFNNVIPLSTAVKAAAMSTYEDYTKVDATYSHFAGRAWTEVNNQYIGAKVERAILPLHKSLRTVTIPLGTKKILFVGLINDCGEKIELENRGNLVGAVKEEILHDKCTVCNQDKDICEQLVAYPKEEIIVTIEGSDYINTIEKFFENGNYFIVRKIWTKDFTDGLVKQVVTTEFLSCFDMLPCGCIEPSQLNIDKIKESCFDCYCKCYSPCLGNEYVEGAYRIDLDNGNIIFNKSFPYDKVYVEYRTALPRINGELVIPELALESIVSGIIFKATEYKKTIPLSERELNQKKYTRAKGNMHKIMCRISLNDLFNSIIKIPKFDLGMRMNCHNEVSSSFKNTFIPSSIGSQNTNSTQLYIPQVKNIQFGIINYTGVLDEIFFDSDALLDKDIYRIAFKDGIQYDVILSGIPDTLKKEVLFEPRVEVSPNVFKARLTWSVPFITGETATLQYYIN